MGNRPERQAKIGQDAWMGDGATNQRSRDFIAEDVVAAIGVTAFRCNHSQGNAVVECECPSEPSRRQTLDKRHGMSLDCEKLRRPATMSGGLVEPSLFCCAAGTLIHEMKRFLHKLLGDKGERAAVRFLKRKGFKILAKQYRDAIGEIDIVAMDGRQIVFTEVKTRKSTENGQPYEAVDIHKQRKLTKLALAWLKKHGRLEQSARFDVISIVWPDDSKDPVIDHFVNAFESTGSGQFYS